MNNSSDQLSMLDIASVEEGALDVHSGQWRLARLELVNWGTFDGYYVLPVDRRGLLITGPSGSGKSTLLDAITTVLTPPRSRHLNAAARSGSAKGEDRTICSYIRGAWRHETDESGEIASAYLRPKKAVWSGIMLRYECGLAYGNETDEYVATRNMPINLVVLYNLKAGSTSRDGLSEMFALVRGDKNLSDFEPYAVGGIDIGKFRRDHKESASVYRDHPPFANAFCRAMGIRSTKTLELLHKTQAAKNFGSLDELFRRFMLEEPATFDQAAEAAEQFSALSKAYDGVVAQRRQMHDLEPLLTLEVEYRKAEADKEKYDRLESSLDGFTEHLVLDNLKAEEERLQREADRLEELVRNVESERIQAEQAFNQAQTLFTEAGGQVLTTAEFDMLNRQQQLEHIVNTRTKLAIDLAGAGIEDIPETYTEWQRLVRQLEELVQQSIVGESLIKDELQTRYAQLEVLKKRLAELDTDLVHFRSRATNIPPRLHQIRTAIAKELGVTADELPFMGELVNVKPEHRQWQGAIERLMGSQAKTLLVAKRYAKAVAHFVESAHLGVRFEFEAIPLEVEVSARSIQDDSVVRKLLVTHHKSHPEYSDWINNRIRERFDFTCVDAPSLLEKHPYALTIGGQIKQKNRYIKDDRFKIDDRSRWILGDTNDEKIKQLEDEKTVLNAQLVTAEKEADAAVAKMNKARDLLRISEALKKAEWSQYDRVTAQKDYEAALALYEQIKQGSKEIASAENLRDKAQKQKEAADTAYHDAKILQGRAADDAKQVAQALHKYKERAQRTAQVTSKDAELLANLFHKEDKDYRAHIDSINRVSRKVLETLHKQGNKALQSLQNTRASIERSLHDFKLNWPVTSADLSDEFSDLEAYLAIYRRIQSNGLPEYEQRFMQVLQDFSKDQITVISSTIRGAYREVKEKLLPVNRSLQMSEYGPGIHLQIEVRDSKSRTVSDFLSELQEITKGIWSDEDLESAESRYLRTAEIIRRFTSDEAADKKWKAACLDTRQHVSFIAKEINSDGDIEGVHGSDAGLSGGQKQKLVIFCLAAALRYQLADEDRLIPSYGTVVLDEAFDKADFSFAETAMDIFEVFGFHMILATPFKLLQTIDKHVGAIAAVSCQDSRRSFFQMVTIEEQLSEDEAEQSTA